MARKNIVEVVIGGKVFKISGFESTEYLHQVAVYINDKLAQFQNVEGYRKQNVDQKQLMLNMNLADDFFKAKKQADKLATELEKREREMYGVRHDLVETRLLKEKLEKDLEDQKEEHKKAVAQLRSEKNALEQRLKETEEKLRNAQSYNVQNSIHASQTYNNNNRSKK